MAHTSFFFIAITAGYFISIVYLLKEVKRPPLLTYGFFTYVATIAMIAIGTVGRSIAIEQDSLAAAHIEIWMNGFSWLACGVSAILLLASFLPPITIQEKTY